MENYSKLGARLRRFAELVAGGETATGAVRIIRPKARRPKEQGWQWRHLPAVSAAIEELQADTRAAFASRELRHKAGIYNRANADRSALLASLLLGDVANALPHDPREWPQELKDCIESVKFKDGIVSEITLSDRNTSARLFSQHMGWMTERHELTGKDGTPIQYEDSRDRNLRTLEQISARLAGATAGETASSGTAPSDRGDGTGGGA